MRIALWLMLLIPAGPLLHAQALPEPSRTITSDSHAVPVYRGFETIAPLFTHRSDTLHVINFWATWCAPCVRELPYFEELTRERTDRPLQVTLVSLDFRKQLESRLLPFLADREIVSRVVVLDDPDANSWIDRVDPSWSGAIPGTLFLKGSTRLFREQTFTRHELHSLVDSLLEHTP